MPSLLKDLLFMAFLVGPLGANVWLGPGQVAKMSIGEEEKVGYATNCGKHPFNVSWTPKLIHPSGKLRVTVVYRLPYEFSGGVVNASLFFHGDKQPFIGYSVDMDCPEVKKYMKFCPIPKGIFIRKTIPFDDLHKLASFPGDYDGLLTVNNKDKKEMLCLKVTATIASSFSGFTYP